MTIKRPRKQTNKMKLKKKHETKRKKTQRIRGKRQRKSKERRKSAREPSAGHLEPRRPSAAGGRRRRRSACLPAACTDHRSGDFADPSHVPLVSSPSCFWPSPGPFTCRSHGLGHGEPGEAVQVRNGREREGERG